MLTAAQRAAKAGETVRPGSETSRHPRRAVWPLCLKIPGERSVFHARHVGKYHCDSPAGRRRGAGRPLYVEVPQVRWLLRRMLPQLPGVPLAGWNPAERVRRLIAAHK